jgi:hypothetical protein
VFVVLDPLPPGAEQPAAAQPPEPASEEVEVTLELAPGKPQVARMPVTRGAAEEFVRLAYVVGGRKDVQTLVDSVDPEAWRGDPAGRDRVRRARGLLVQAVADLDFDAGEALGEIELEARQVFVEMLESARAATQLSLAGLIETPPGALRFPVPSLNAPPYGDGGATYRALRASVVELDAGAREIHAAEEALQAARVRQTIFDFIHLRLLVSGQLPAPQPGAGGAGTGAAGRVLADAQTSYAKTLARHAEQFPVLSMVAGEIVKETTSWTKERLAELAADRSSYDNELDRLIRRAVGKARSNTWESSFSLAEKHLETSDDVLARVGRAPPPQVLFTRVAVVVPPPSKAPPPEETYAEHPLWRYPLIVHAALERLGAQPGSFPHAAASEALRLAETHAVRRAAAQAKTERALDWACFGFGVLAFVPVVGQLALVAAMAGSAVQAVSAASSFLERSEEAQAFGPYAAKLGLAEPEGIGLIVLAFAGLAFDVLPVWRACGALAARLVRLRALPRPATPGLIDVLGTGSNLVALATAEAAYRAGVEETRP